jgi:uncharacterized protein YrrD
MDAAELRDREIVSVAGANRLGKVREVLFETQPLRVAALKASGDEGEFIISLDRVSRFGPDAVMVESPNVREIARAARDTERTLDELTHLKVVDEDGRSLGTVRSIEFDPQSGDVERVIAGEGGMLGMGGTKATIRRQGIRGVGMDLLTVASSQAHDDQRHESEHEAERYEAEPYEADAGTDERARAE